MSPGKLSKLKPIVSLPQGTNKEDEPFSFVLAWRKTMLLLKEQPTHNVEHERDEAMVSCEW